jgi:hypothetical protein
MAASVGVEIRVGWDPMSPRIEVIGAYRVEVDDDLIGRAFEIKYGGLDLSESESGERRDEVIEELSGLVLIELLVHGRDDRFDVGDFGQSATEQVAYDEAFLSADGTAVVAHVIDPPAMEPLRVAFFLHSFDPSEPLETSYGTFEVPALQAMPERLLKLRPYEPVD